MSECSEGGLIEAIQPWVATAVTIIGWWAVHRYSEARARRQEDAVRVADIETRIGAIRDLAEAYYTSDPRAPERRAEAAQLRNRLQELSSRIRMLAESRKGQYRLDDAVRSFRMAVTGGDFDSARPQRSHDDQVVRNLWSTAASLARALQASYEKAN